MNKRDTFLILMILVLTISMLGYHVLKNQDYYSDELPHSNQIFKFI